MNLDLRNLFRPGAAHPSGCRFDLGQTILRLGDALVGGSEGRGDGFAASL